MLCLQPSDLLIYSVVFECNGTGVVRSSGVGETGLGGTGGTCSCAELSWWCGFQERNASSLSHFFFGGPWWLLHQYRVGWCFSDSLAQGCLHPYIYIYSIYHSKHYAYTQSTWIGGDSTKMNDIISIKRKCWIASPTQTHPNNTFYAFLKVFDQALRQNGSLCLVCARECVCALSAS